ncbi:hypothetical protein HPB50_020678 [Hyalomma asiaticum]|uniref:Uncharacterized protein n=1 Tax=Hyalomma asiaticum TaxID=266040 RepID=A0ACB7SHP3_HYAAI|nr:hypothetical protein HPB50_020678 [Hyalomma asiaticum]
MEKRQREIQRCPPQAFDNATYVKSGDQLAEHGSPNRTSWYYNPPLERSQMFDFARSFDGQDRQLHYYRHDPDVYAMKGPWLAAQQGVHVRGEEIWPAIRMQIPALPARLNHQSTVVSESVATSSVRGSSAVSCGRTDRSKRSATSSSGCSSSSSGNGSYSARPDRSPYFDSQSLRSPSGKRWENRVSWATCAPVVMMALLVAFLLLVSLATMARSNRVMAAISAVASPNVNYQKPQMMSSSATMTTFHAPALPMRSTKASAWTGSPVGTRNVTTLQDAEGETATPTFTANAETWVETAGNKFGRHGETAKKATTPSVRADDYESIDAGEDSEDLMAFPFQRPTRPMCGDVFYTVCRQNSEQREFHYRRSVNACVETAADTVHSCNRGVNRFASIAHCRRSCVGTAHRPARECFGKPLFTNCARQDVLSSWWFFEGRKCVPWNFPSGGCPADDSAVFRTAHECRTRCLAGGLRRSPCGPPRSVACGQRHLKHPFFADLSSRDGRIRCLRSSPDVLRDRRCLTGANRFRTREACIVTCKDKQTV